MQNDKICSDIISAMARTRTEVNLLLSEVDLLLRAIYIVGQGNFEEAMQTSVRAKTSLAVSSLVAEQNREEVLKNLKDKLNSLDYLGLTIAFEPTMQVVGKISTWIKQNVGDSVALDITIDKSILGGAVIEYKGKVVRSILLSKVEDYFANTNVNF